MSWKHCQGHKPIRTLLLLLDSNVVFVFPNTKPHHATMLTRTTGAFSGVHAHGSENNECSVLDDHPHVMLFIQQDPEQVNTLRQIRHVQ